MKCVLILRIRRWISQVIEDPEYKICQFLLRFMKPDSIPDRMFIKYQYHRVFGHVLDLKNPKTFNEKLNWLKLYDRNPLYTTLVDKVKVKEWIAEKIGEQYTIPTLGVYDSVDEIDFDALPRQFVLKCSHDSGSVIICKDKSTFNIIEAKERLSKALKVDYYLNCREWPYKYVPRRILIEQYLKFDGEIIMDYRIYCFNGIPRFVYAYTNKETYDGSKPEVLNCNYYDIDWNPLSFHQHSLPGVNVKKPNHLEMMIEKASIIAEGMPFVRVDFYDTDIILFGEMTLYPGAGMSPFYPESSDVGIGDMLNIHMLEK